MIYAYNAQFAQGTSMDLSRISIRPYNANYKGQAEATTQNAIKKELYLMLPRINETIKHG